MASYKKYRRTTKKGSGKYSLEYHFSSQQELRLKISSIHLNSINKKSDLWAALFIIDNQKIIIQAL